MNHCVLPIVCTKFTFGPNATTTAIISQDKKCNVFIDAAISLNQYVRPFSFTQFDFCQTQHQLP